MLQYQFYCGANWLAVCFHHYSYFSNDFLHLTEMKKKSKQKIKISRCQNGSALTCQTEARRRFISSLVISFSQLLYFFYPPIIVGKKGILVSLEKKGERKKRDFFFRKPKRRKFFLGQTKPLFWFWVFIFFLLPQIPGWHERILMLSMRDKTNRSECAV